jgi:hypothetical protein
VAAIFTALSGHAEGVRWLEGVAIMSIMLTIHRGKKSG